MRPARRACEGAIWSNPCGAGHVFAGQHTRTRTTDIRPIARGRALAAALFVFLAGAAVDAAAQSIGGAGPRTTAYPGVIRLDVDATDLERRIVRVRERVPVQPGELVLRYPRFIPGTHGPTGRVGALAGLRIAGGGGAPIAWRRDPLDPFAFRVDVPAGTGELGIEFEFLSHVVAEPGRVSITREIVDLQWDTVVLAPGSHAASAISVEARLRIPGGWTAASALPRAPAAADDAGWLRFAPASLETLVDSPVFAGRFVRRVELEPAGSARPVALNLFADDASALEAGQAQLDAHRALVQQADRLFGARHFRRYEFLLALSERLGAIGLEHHESSENAVRPRYFKDWARRAGSRDLLAHEYVHSWNGKFRRPKDLWTAGFDEPMQGSLLWVYEGQTQFWGRVLAARSGLVTPAQARDGLAQAAASLDARAGRLWRSLQDSTSDPLAGGRGSKDWTDWQRGADYYDEGTLIWLDVDMRIREASGGARSLDDFARAFFGSHDGRVEPLLYDFDDVVAALERVQPFDWRAFLRQRLDRLGAGAPLDGLARAGWRLAWADAPSEYAREPNDFEEEHADDFAYSIGLRVKKSGRIDEVLWESPAFKAGLSRAAELVAVNGVAYRAERLAAAIAAAAARPDAPIDLLVRELETYRTVRVDWRGGLRYPRLERIENAPERLDAGLLAPRR